MIITCPCGEKYFNVNPNLIPDKGRTLKCGSCGKKWFYKKETTSREEENNPYKFKQMTTNEESVDNIKKVQSDSENDKIKNTTKTIKKIKKENKNNLNFFKIIFVIIISFSALILLLDTFKIQISNIYPNIDFLLDSLYETFIDIYLFFKDLVN